MRSRCLLNTPGITITVANPRLTALTSPTSFDAEVIQKARACGQAVNALCSVQCFAGRECGEARTCRFQRAWSRAAGGWKLRMKIRFQPWPKDEQALESLTDKKGLARKVIHHLMPRYRLVSSPCSRLASHVHTARTRQHPHQEHSGGHHRRAVLWAERRDIRARPCQARQRTQITQIRWIEPSVHPVLEDLL